MRIWPAYKISLFFWKLNHFFHWAVFASFLTAHCFPFLFLHCFQTVQANFYQARSIALHSPFLQFDIVRASKIFSLCRAFAWKPPKNSCCTFSCTSFQWYPNNSWRNHKFHLTCTVIRKVTRTVSCQSLSADAPCFHHLHTIKKEPKLKVSAQWLFVNQL